MAYRLVYHPAVRDEDTRRIPADMAARIARAIRDRLTSSPEQYGAPLRGTLKGYWKLRVADYRVVYKVVKDEVRIFAIRHRRDIYDEAATRRAEWD